MFVHQVNEEIYIKPLSLEDARALFQLTNDSREYLREWLPWLDTIKRVEDTQAFIEASIKGFAEHRLMNAAIHLNQEIVGVAGFNELDWTNKTAYIGYWLGKAHQGKGIMTKVVDSLTDHAIQELGFNRIDIRAAVGNHKSRSIPERLGYQQEGILREAEWLYDHFVDHAVYSMLAKDWQNRS